MEEPFWRRPLADVAAELQTRPTGLSSAEAARRLARFGPNAPKRAPAYGLLREALGFFANPLVAILLVAAFVSAAFGEVLNALLITGLIGLSMALNVVQTHRSLQAAESLRRSVTTRAQVWRDGRSQTIQASQVVPGDVFELAAGDMVPADGRLLEAKDLYADQAALTGESFPAEKQAGELPPERLTLDEATNAVFAGTSVLSGTGRAIAVHTGPATAFGAIAAELEAAPPPTEFERGMTAFSILILRVTVALVLFVFMVLSLFKHHPLEALLFSVALAVGLTPEFLPMIVTVTLASGAMRMAKKRVIVKQLQAIENFGSIDVLCSDKTGTLTEGAIAFERAVDFAGRPAPEVLVMAVLNSRHETGIHSPLDQALMQSPCPPLPAFTKQDEVPFDFHRRRLSVIGDLAGRRALIAKGAPEGLLAQCTRYRDGAADQPLTAEARARCDATFQSLSESGLRVLAVAEREVEAQPSYEPQDERDLTFLGFVAFQDPPRADVADTLASLGQDGIRVVILTGDNEWVTRHVCEAVGIATDRVLLGQDLEAILPQALPRVVERVDVFARLTPEQKSRVIRALKSGGHVVGYLGDGINDAPSLRVADVGISVDSAVDVAKEAAPIILLDKSLATLHQGVLEGRRSFVNVLKYIMMGTSSNFGNMASMAGAALFLPFLPMLPLQILLNNLLYDASQLPIPGDRVDTEALSRPRRWNIQFIQSFMLHMGPVSSLFDFLTFGLLLWVFHAGAPLFRTGWFVESLLTQTLVIFIIRTRANPLQSKPSLGLTLSVSLVCVVAVALPYTPVGRVLHFVPLPPSLLAAILVMTGCYLVMAEGVKRLFYRRLDRDGGNSSPR